MSGRYVGGPPDFRAKMAKPDGWGGLWAFYNFRQWWPRHETQATTLSVAPPSPGASHGAKKFLTNHIPYIISHATQSRLTTVVKSP